MRNILSIVAFVMAQPVFAQSEQDIRVVQSLLVANYYPGVEVTGVQDKATFEASEKLAAYLKPKHKIANNPVATIRALLDEWPGYKAGGVYQGHYTCANVRTPVTVTLVGSRSKFERQAIFEFGERGSPNHPWGIFNLRLKDKYSRTLELLPDTWIVQPQGYSMVGVKAKVEDDILSGEISAEGCEELTATRVATSVECRKITTSLGEKCAREPDSIADAAPNGPVIPKFCTATKGAYGEAKLKCDVSRKLYPVEIEQMRVLTEMLVPTESDTTKWLNTLKSQASFYLGFMYLEGLSVEQDAETARRLLEQSALGLKSYQVSILPNADKVYGRYSGQTGHHVNVPALVNDLYLDAFADGTLSEDAIGASELSKINAAVTRRGRRGEELGLVAVIERLGKLPIVDEADRRSAYGETLQRLAPDDALAAWLGHTWLNSRWEDYLVTAARLGHPEAAAIVGMRLSQGDTFNLSRGVKILKSERDQLSIELLTLASRAGNEEAGDALSTLVARLDTEEAARLAREKEKAEEERLRQEKREIARAAAKQRREAQKKAFRALDIQPIKRSDVQRALE